MSEYNKSINFVKEEFKKYYLNEFLNRETVPNIDEREFGFQFWDGPMFQRHLDFSNRENLNHFLDMKNPRHCYSSAALYELPGEKNINNKGWMGCDFVIDIDADHVDLPCQKEHDEYVCSTCGKKGKGKPPHTCSCNGTSFKKRIWVCEECLKFSKNETIKIIDQFFMPDFGLTEDDFLIKFSGNRGYHIQILSEAFRKLDQDSRREIADYITGKNIDLKLQGFEFGRQGIIGPEKSEKGWNRRIFTNLLRFFKETTKQELESLLRYKKISDIILNNREAFIKNFEKNKPLWNEIKLSSKNWKKIIEYAIEKYAGKIDEPVSTDTKRLLRLPNSLHGKTGFQAKIVSYEELNTFNPLTDALVFEGDIKVKFKKCPLFHIRDHPYGPYEGGETELIDKSAAIFFICKGRAELI